MAKLLQGIEDLKAADDLPRELDLQPLYANSPMGKIFGTIFSWTGPDHDRGRTYLDKITSLAPVLMTQVAPCTLAETLANNAPLVPPRAYSNPRSMSIKTLTPKVVEIIQKYCSLLPDDLAATVTWHELRDCSPSLNHETRSPAVFGTREPCYILEILSSSVNEANFKAVSEWGISFKEELEREVPEQLLESKWIPLTPSEEFGGIEKLFGKENAAFLRKLKKEKDPKGIFRYALPSLVET